MSNQTIQLQSIGHVPAIPAGQLKIGQVTVWNFGSTETIVSKIKETAKTIVFQIRDDKSGNLHQRRLNKTRLVAIR